jgi:outer membrane protein assembly factor BamB
VRCLLAGATVVAALSGCITGADAVRPLRDDPRKLGEPFPTPAWRLGLEDSEVDIFERLPDGRLLVGTSRAGETGMLVSSQHTYTPRRLFAVDVRSGARLWTFDRSTLGDMPERLVAMGEDVAVLAVDRDAEAVYVGIDLRSGEKRWERKVDKPEAPLLLASDLLVFTVQRRSRLEVTAVRLGDGEARWTATLDGFPRVEKATPNVMADFGDLVAMADDMVRLDGASGAIRWRKPFPWKPGGRPGALFVADGLVVTDGAGFALVDRASGDVRWRHGALGETAGMVGSSGGAVFVEMRAQGGSALRALDAATGNVIWTAKESGRVRSPFVQWGELLVYTTPSEVVALSHRSGKATFRTELRRRLLRAAVLRRRALAGRGRPRDGPSERRPPVASHRRARVEQPVPGDVHVR